MTAMMTSRYTKDKEAGQTFSQSASGRPFRGYRPRRISTPRGVLEHEVKAWDRLDLLAIYYYNDAHKWWRILDANPQINFAADVNFSDGDASLVGTSILIPKDA